MAPILLAVDRSDHSLAAFNYVVEHLLKPDDKLVILHVFSHPVQTAYVGADMLAGTIGSLVEMEKSAETFAKDLGEGYKKICDNRGIPCEVHVYGGDARDLIVELAESLKVKLIALGSHGYGAVKRAFLGSVSDYVVHHSKIPVLIIKTPSALP
eukprot:Colp12_sorted_trinity150504_noHs@8151